MHVTFLLVKNCIFELKGPFELHHSQEKNQIKSQTS